VDALRDVPNTIVLIRGETGTGKNLVAKTIHYHSAWNAGRFLEINCAALPDNLLESELFGYEKGAFTDARAAKPGLLELADGGTLFLDEIDSMSLTLQAKLLQFLESRTFRRLGGTEDIKVTTAHPLRHERRPRGARGEEGVPQGPLLPDQRGRPPAAGAPQMGPDVLSIARGIVRQFNAELKRDVEGFTPEAERKLLAHDWPGNVRELRNVLERAMIFARGNKLDAADLVLLSHRGVRGRRRRTGTSGSARAARWRTSSTSTSATPSPRATPPTPRSRASWGSRRRPSGRSGRSTNLDEQPEESGVSLPPRWRPARAPAGGPRR
jgi:two-component system, NtrC family, response regulator AtoC